MRLKLDIDLKAEILDVATKSLEAANREFSKSWNSYLLYCKRKRVVLA